VTNTLDQTLNLWDQLQDGRWIPNAFIDTGLSGRTPGIPECGITTTVDSIINGVDVGQPQNARHQWGDCTVQDFNGGPLGWVMVDFTHGTNIVRNGILNGWVTNGGGPGLGCVENQEYAVGNGARQDFENGSLYWFQGMQAAEVSNFTPTDGELPVMLLTYYYQGKGVPVVIDWSYIKADPALMFALKSLPADGIDQVYESSPGQDGAIYYALGAFSIARTPDGCYVIGDTYDYEPNKIANWPYIFDWLDSKTGTATEFKERASGCDG
jgi:hypothetical protein